MIYSLHLDFLAAAIVVLLFFAVTIKISCAVWYVIKSQFNSILYVLVAVRQEPIVDCARVPRKDAD